MSGAEEGLFDGKHLYRFSGCPKRQEVGAGIATKF